MPPAMRTRSSTRKAKAALALSGCATPTTAPTPESPTSIPASELPPSPATSKISPVPSTLESANNPLTPRLPAAPQVPTPESPVGALTSDPSPGTTAETSPEPFTPRSAPNVSNSKLPTTPQGSTPEPPSGTPTLEPSPSTTTSEAIPESSTLGSHARVPMPQLFVTPQASAPKPPINSLVLQLAANTPTLASEPAMPKSPTDTQTPASDRPTNAPALEIPSNTPALNPPTVDSPPNAQAVEVEVPGSNSVNSLSNVRMPKHPARVARRAFMAKVAAKAIDIDQKLNESIDEGAMQLDVPHEYLATHFALKSSFGEKRGPSVWNGLMSEKAAEWRSEFTGNKKEYMPWVAKRICEEKLAEKLSEEDKQRYADLALATRIEKKKEGITHSRSAVMKSAQQSLAKVQAELMYIHKQTGVEYALFATRPTLRDTMCPLFYSSDKVTMFLEAHINVPIKDFLQLMDMSVVGGIGGLGASLLSEKGARRKSVRALLNAAFCKTLNDLGHDTSKFKHIEYTNYNKTVDKYHVVVQGYPLTSKGHLVQPSDYPGGIKGLAHAEKHLMSGAWGFEQVTDEMYDEWKAMCQQASDAGATAPPPHVPAPGTEFEIGANSRDAINDANVKNRKRKHQSETASKNEGQTSKERTSAGSSKKRRIALKSAEIIDSESEDRRDLQLGVEDSEEGTDTESEGQGESGC
ncbi:hypothetical protein CTheo_8326 [Ceratobasidium theobromae]|uniref:Uncharacterized protein n=1 Tax=Ceratobasidium theobromae TaxID=1582974 RepID=A0A5N5Q8W4_9AGAM|nr:hypothetical protein CTheo_8326 [Ceratobasidium theobromae]